MSKNLTEPFGVNVGFNVLHKTGEGINIKIMKETALYLERCASIIMRDPENKFNREATKCAGRLYLKANKIRDKIDELKEVNYE